MKAVVWSVVPALLLIVLGSVVGRPYLLFANRKDIRLLEITDNKRKAASKIIVRNLEDAAALDFFLEKNKVCWTEINREVIRCADIDPRAKGKKNITDVVTSGLIKPEGLAADWLGNKLYWTDSDTKRIEVAGLSGRQDDRAVLVWRDLDLPRAISVAPHDGLMFWTDWGEFPKIERCGMNGDPETRQILVDNDLVWPNGLTLDYENKRLYWMEAKLAYIASVDWNGSTRKTILVGNEKTLPQPFAMTLFKDTFYWTDWDTNSLHMYSEATEVVDKVKIKGKLSPMDLRIFDPSRQSASKTPFACGVDNGGCSHLCLAAVYKPGFSCHCPTGIQLFNKTHCFPQNHAILLLAARSNIRKISLDTKDFTDKVIPLTGVINAIAIDYDPVNGKVFWTDDQVKAVRAANLNGSEEENVITVEVSHPNGVAVDWIAGQLFWTDTGTDRIEVAKLNGSNRRVVISEDLDEPRGIVLDLVYGWMFWSDWGKQPRIERAWLDGRGRQVIVETDIVWPNGIALDIERSKLYWCDAKMDRIEMSNVDGSGRTTILDDVPHPFGFALLDEYLYWTDWQERSIERINKHGGTAESEVLVSHLDDLMGVKAVLVSPNPNVSNACAEGHCSHLCLFTPDGARCACASDHELLQDNRTCEIPEAILVFTRRDDIRRIGLDSSIQNNFVIPVKNVEEASAIDFDQTDGRIYWSDIHRKTISSAFVNGSNLDVVVEFGLEVPEGLAVDWMAGNLYWSDMGVNRIEVARVDGSHRRVLIWKDLESPKSVAIDPINGNMYWSSWGNEPVIETALLDGSSRSVFLEDVGQASGLTVDLTRNRLYWAVQDRGEIVSSSLSSPFSPITVISGSIQPYALTLFGSWLYWTDWSKKTIERAALESPATNRSVLLSGVDYVMDVMVYHDFVEGGENPCQPNNGGCEALCLAKPSQGVTCECPSHYTIMPDGQHCEGPKSFLLFGQKNKISRMISDTDMSNEVPDIVLPIKHARNIQSLGYDPTEQMIYWVDLGSGKIDDGAGRQIIMRSRDTRDSHALGVFETSDRMTSCNPFDLVIDPFTRTIYWTCVNTNAINATRLGDPQSILGDDLIPIGALLVGGANDRPRLLALEAEQQVLFVTMLGNGGGAGTEGGARLEMIDLTANTRKVLVDDDLGEITAVASDENNVYWMDGIKRRMESCGIDGSGRRVIISEGVVEPVALAVQGQWIYWADKDQATIVRVDKRTGTSRQVVLSKVSRLSSIVAVDHIPASALESHPCHTPRCSHFCSSSNSTAICSCPLGLILSDDLRSCTSPPTCRPDEFTCSSPGSRLGPPCIPLQWRCDGQSECGDSTDEIDCPECGAALFRCQDGQCIPSDGLCDGKVQCDDGTDEIMCCAKNQFHCSVSRECIENALMCDGHEDCSDATDELQPSCNLVTILPQTETEVIENTSSSTYLIAVFVVLISLLITVLSIFYYKKRTVSDPVREEGDGTKALAPEPEMTDLLELPTQLLRAAPVGRQSHHGSSNGQSYNRSHITGASSNTGTSSSGHYPGPPPSPATSFASRPSLPRYQYYRPAPPCTPCSTDVADESDSVLYSMAPHRPHFTTRAPSLAYDSEGPYGDHMELSGMGPPPSTPLYLSDYGEQEASCPPSPTTETSFFLNPYLSGPPPSPVPSPTRQCLEGESSIL